MRIAIRALEDKKDFIQSCILEAINEITYSQNNVQKCLEINRKLHPNYSIKDHQNHIESYEKEILKHDKEIVEIDKAIEVLNQFL